MHRAPVVGILVLDGHSVPLPEPLEVAHDLSKSPDMQGGHQLLVVSEEQFKVLLGYRRAPWESWGRLGSSEDGLVVVSAVDVCKATEAQKKRGGGAPGLQGQRGGH